MSLRIWYRSGQNPPFHVDHLSPGDGKNCVGLKGPSENNVGEKASFDLCCHSSMHCNEMTVWAVQLGI